MNARMSESDASMSASRDVGRPSARTGVSPLPMPSMARPDENRSIVQMACAVTSGCRREKPVTHVPS